MDGVNKRVELRVSGPSAGGADGGTPAARSFASTVGVLGDRTRAGAADPHSKAQAQKNARSRMGTRIFFVTIA